MRAFVGSVIAAAMLAGSMTGTLTAAGAAAADAPQAAVERITGVDHYETAAKIAGGTCDKSEGSRDVVVASGENWPDALAAASLDRPLLFTRPGALPESTREYLAPCGGDPEASVLLLGGPSAVGTAVETEIAALGWAVERIAGADRYETAYKIATRAVAELPDSHLQFGHVATGTNHADAVAVAGAVDRRNPLVLTTPDRLHPQARRFIEENSMNWWIVGGPSAVSEAVVSEVRETAALKNSPSRLAGLDRYGTSAIVAKESLLTPGCEWPRLDVWVVSGTAPYAGLAAGASRSTCGPLLLAPPGDKAPAAVLWFAQHWRVRNKQPSQATVTGVGSAEALSDAMLRSVASGLPQAAPETENGTSEIERWEARAAESVVQVVCWLEEHSIAASGFVVGDGRTVVTNQHVVFEKGEPCLSIELRTGATFTREAGTHPGRYITDVTLLRASEARDLALLRIPDHEAALTPFEIAPAEPEIGDEAVILGFPGASGNKVLYTSGHYKGETPRFGSNGGNWANLTTPGNYGNSGSGVFNSRHQIIGVVAGGGYDYGAQPGSATHMVSTYAVPAADLKALLKGTLGD